MKRSYYFLLVLFSVSIFTQSCEENSTEPNINNDVLIPLKVGNYWKALFYDYDFGGEPDTVGIYVVKDSVWNNEKIYRISQSPDSIDYEAPFYINRYDGCYFLFDVKSNPILYFKFPVKEGETYMSIVGTMCVEKINVEYTVPAGTFKCYKYVTEYAMDDVINKTIIYFSPGIGQIATENYYKDNNRDMYLESKWELIEYKVK
ncbi:MAG: hypothetical protein V1779_13555 [bacterium]